MRGNVPEGWQRLRLDEVAHIQTGVAKNDRVPEPAVEMPYLRVANVQDGYLDLSEIKNIRIEQNKVNRYLLQDGDVLLTEGGDFDKLGRGTIWRSEIPKCLHQNHVFAVRLDQERVLPIFFAFLAASSYGKQYFLSCAKQTTNLASINKTQLSEFPVLLPPLAEQRAIARILSTWDEAIATAERLLAALQERKRGLMQRLLTGEVRLPGFAEDTWVTIPLIEVASKKPYSFTGGPFGSNLKSTEYTESGVRIIQLQNIGDGEFLDDYKIYTSIEKADELISCNIYPGDIILSKMGDPVARAAMLPSTEPRFLMASDGIRLVVDESAHDSFFILTQINASSFRQAAFEHSTGSTRRRINLNDLRELPIQVTSLEEQRSIAQVFSTVDQQIEALKKYKAALQFQKKGLMQRLLTGEVRVGAETEPSTNG